MSKPPPPPGKARARLEAFVDAAIRREILMGELQRLACVRHRRDVEAGNYYFDDEEADQTVDTFFPALRHWKGAYAGKPFYLEDWQVFVVCSILCWKERDTRLRRFREAYTEIPRKNGKTFLAAGIGTYLFIADGEPGADIYTAATKKDQAKIAHEDAKQVIAKSPDLNNRCLILKDNISDPSTSSKYEPLGRDSMTADGLNPHGALVDEYHAHKTPELYDVIKTGMGARLQPLLFIITTAGFLLDGPCKQRHDLGVEILNGRVVDDEMFVFIACPDDGDDWREESTWRKANPNYGVSVNPKDIARACRNAQELTSEQNSFLTKRLNIWVGQAERWVDMALWEVCHKQSIQELEGRRCYGGLDLSSVSDITACVWVFPDEDGSMYDVLCRFWVPTDSAILRERKDRVPYRAWAKEGWIELTDGGVVDYDFVRAQVLRDTTTFDVQDVAFDRWNATQIANDLMNEDVNMIQFGQGYASMSEPSKMFERLWRQGRLRLGNNPVLRWMASNCATETDAAENIKPSKKRSGEKIDGIVSLIMAIGRANLDDDHNSVYETRGLTVL